ncbi:hypothetical protein C2124_13380 [Ralstonia solanacearum]|nr:hypothetical protein C2124_13380 [Ralstonia solanacearum]
MTQDPGGSDLLRRNTERRVRIRSALTNSQRICGFAYPCLPELSAPGRIVKCFQSFLGANP